MRVTGWIVACAACGYGVVARSATATEAHVRLWQRGWAWCGALGWRCPYCRGIAPPELRRRKAA